MGSEAVTRKQKEDDTTVTTEKDVTEEATTVTSCGYKKPLAMAGVAAVVVPLVSKFTMRKFHKVLLQSVTL